MTMAKSTKEATIVKTAEELKYEVTFNGEKLDPKYVKAFLDRDEKPASEYNQNTTSWD